MDSSVIGTLYRAHSDFPGNNYKDCILKRIYKKLKTSKKNYIVISNTYKKWLIWLNIDELMS